MKSNLYAHIMYVSVWFVNEEKRSENTHTLTLKKYVDRFLRFNELQAICGNLCTVDGCCGFSIGKWIYS